MIRIGGSLHMKAKEELAKENKDDLQP